MQTLCFSVAVHWEKRLRNVSGERRWAFYRKEAFCRERKAVCVSGYESLGRFHGICQSVSFDPLLARSVVRVISIAWRGAPYLTSSTFSNAVEQHSAHSRRKRKIIALCAGREGWWCCETETAISAALSGESV
jgi:hypothetical protein